MQVILKESSDCLSSFGGKNLKCQFDNSMLEILLHLPADQNDNIFCIFVVLKEHIMCKS